ncbi:MAG: response regulator transcription factor [Microbacteriaceae bacterium]
MSRRRVLIVDDNVDICALVALKLESAGIDVVQTFDGVSGLAVAQAGPVDAIILDVELPGLSGLDVLATLRNAGNAVPVIMLSGQNHAADVRAGLDAGANDYVTKPFSPRDLLARVQSLCAP